MNLYNFRFIQFGNGTMQLRRYQQPVLVNRMTEEEKDELKEQRMILEDEMRRDNPFTKERCRIVGEIVVYSDGELADRQERSLRNSLNRTQNKLYELSRSNKWEWFLTFTFNDSVDRFDYKICCSVLRKWLDNVKQRYAKDLKYVIVPERHKSGAWHFHGLFANMGKLVMVQAQNNDKDSCYYGDYLRTSYPDGDYIYNLSGFTRGYTTATKIINTYKAGNYILKYVTKDLCSVIKGKNRYFASKGLVTPNKSLGLLDDRDFEEFMGYLVEEVPYDLTYSKTVTVENEGYSNGVTYYEFAPVNKEEEYAHLSSQNPSFSKRGEHFAFFYFFLSYYVC